MVVSFQSDDVSYLQWLSENPDCWVLNYPTNLNSKATVLHRSSCKFISRQDGKNGQFTARQYRKAASHNRDELILFAQSLGIENCQNIRTCSQCQHPAETPPKPDESLLDQQFLNIFRQGNAPGQASFLSRVFGIFSEEIVRIWARDARSPYLDLGRPTLRQKSDDASYTLDFTLVSRKTRKAYVCEMKCEIEYQNFKYATLENPKQIEHHKKKAFLSFLSCAKSPETIAVSVKKSIVPVSGAILIWGDCTSQGKKSAIETHGFHDVLSIASICKDLIIWENQEYFDHLENRKLWCNQLFSGLIQPQ